MNVLLVLPLLIPMTAATVSMLAWRSGRAQRVLRARHGAASRWRTFAPGISVARRHSGRAEGGWPAPFGITFVADLFRAIMVALAGVVGLAAPCILWQGWIGRARRFGYYPLVHILLLGVCGAFLTGDLFNLYVWFEVMLMASFVLLALGGERRQRDRRHQVRNP